MPLPSVVLARSALRAPREGLARLELRAVDLAGNESASHPPVAIEADCSVPPPQPAEPEVGPVLGAPEESEPTVNDAPYADSAGNVDDMPAARAPAGRTSLGCAIARAPQASPLVMLAGVLSLLGRRASRARRSESRRSVLGGKLP